MKKWKVSMKSRIEEVEVLRETAQFVVLTWTGWDNKPTERRESKTGDYHRYFDNETEAVDYLAEYWRAETGRLKRKTNEANGRALDWESRLRKLQGAA